MNAYCVSVVDKLAVTMYRIFANSVEDAAEAAKIIHHLAHPEVIGVKVSEVHE